MDLGTTAAPHVIRLYLIRISALNLDGVNTEY